MSSTRVKNRKSPQLDFYETPRHSIAPFLRKSGLDFEGRAVLEPAAGRGAIVRAIPRRYRSFVAVEIQEIMRPDLERTGAEVHIIDFLQWQDERDFDVIITNPPFSQATSFIEKSQKLLSASGRLVMLLRLPFLAGLKRSSLFQEYRPMSVYVLSQRPKFGGDNIDSCDYAWFVWGKGSSQETTLDWVLPDLPHEIQGLE